MRAHGTWSRYTRGCRCDPCRAGGRAYRQLRARRIAEGFQPSLVAEPYRRFLIAFMDAQDWTLAETAAAAHLNTTTLRALVRGRTMYVTTRTAVAVRALIVYLPASAPADTEDEPASAPATRRTA